MLPTRELIRTGRKLTMKNSTTTHRDEFADPLIRNVWEADCVEMVLTQLDVELPKRITGKGYLRQDSDGTIHFKLYPTQTENLDPFRFFPDFGKPGEIIRRSQFYALEAIDWYGRHWKCAQVLPRMPSSFCHHPPQVLAEGKLEHLYFEKEDSYPAKCNGAKLVYFVDLEIPATGVTKTSTEIGGKLRGWASALDHATFVSSCGEFSVRTEPGQYRS